MQYQTPNNTLNTKTAINTNTSDLMLPEDLTLETPFWSFSLSIWKKPQAQTALLCLQDNHDLMVNRLLFCSWLAFEGRELIINSITKDTQLNMWQQQTVAPLRSLRKQLKIVALHHPQLKTTVQSAELQAEQIEQALLFKNVNRFSQSTTKRNTLETLSFNLLSYTQEALKESGENDINTSIYPHLVTLIHALIPEYDPSQGLHTQEQSLL